MLSLHGTLMMQPSRLCTRPLRQGLLGVVGVVVVMMVVVVVLVDMVVVVVVVLQWWW